jgi:hypothetical protein
MTVANQLPPSQLGILFDGLERPYEHKNPKAIHNFGLVKPHVGVAAKATELLQTAMHLGVPEARGALGHLLFKAW